AHRAIDADRAAKDEAWNTRLLRPMQQGGRGTDVNPSCQKRISPRRCGQNARQVNDAIESVFLEELGYKTFIRQVSFTQAMALIGSGHVGPQRTDAIARRG